MKQNKRQYEYKEKYEYIGNKDKTYRIPIWWTFNIKAGSARWVQGQATKSGPNPMTSYGGGVTSVIHQH